MAAVMSAKRPRALTNGIDSASGLESGNRNKRLRQSPHDEDEQSASNQGSDGSDDDEEDATREREQMIWATQQVQKNFGSSRNLQNVPADSGIIEEIRCVNFMCHVNLVITLGPLINFIIGHNGSGKSAVLTALQICLGGKATATNRAQNLKSLIKEGENHSSVRVRIKNQGPLAFKPHLYGKSISVERHFNITGASGFKLRDENDKIVTTKKAELEDILDAFSLQIDNPMNVLTQDMARQFLNHSTPRDKYKFFLTGTQLEALHRDYQQIESSLELMQSREEYLEETIEICWKHLEMVSSKARRAGSLEQMRSQERELEKQAAWAEVEKDEKEVMDAVNEITALGALIDKGTREADEASVAFDRAEAAVTGAQEDVTELTTQLEPKQQAAQESLESFQAVKQELLNLKSDQRKANSDFTMKKKQVQDLEAGIEQLKQRQAEADDGLYAEKQQELEVAKADCEQKRETFDAHDTGLPEIQKQLRDAHRERQAAEQAVGAAQNTENQIKATIRGLRGNNRDWKSAYPFPQKLDKLLDAIRNSNRFRETPVGPLGRHVKLVEADWAYILEKQFGAALNAFIVTSKQDQTALDDLMKRSGWRSPIAIVKKDRIDTSAHEPDQSLMTWMRALAIEDDLVRNQLIINHSFEQVVLIADSADGARFMAERGSMSKNVKMCFTFFNGDKRRGRLISYTGSGGINHSPIDEWRGQLRMQIDKEDQIRQEEERLEHAARATKEAQEKYKRLSEEVSACKAREEIHARRKKQLQHSFQKAQERVESLEAELHDATPDATAIEVLEDQLRTANEDHKRIEGVLDDMGDKKCSLDEDNAANKRKLEAAQREVEDVLFKLKKAQAKVKAMQGKREDALKAKNKALESIQRFEKNRQEWEDERVRVQAIVDRKIAEVMTVYSERVVVPEGKSQDDLLRTLRRLKQTREETEKQLGGSQEELLRQASEAKSAHKEARDEYVSIGKVKRELVLALQERQRRWKLFRSGISVLARVTFTYLLAERKFRGQLFLDHRKQALEIQVEPDSMAKGGDGRQTKTLSGGEKSFSTVCLLLSLWDAMGSPIRCLDEFDVFMDSVNRDRSMKMIITAARRSTGRQFIFITPQSMNNVQQEADVKIIRMTDPERGQTSLPYTRA